MLPLHPLLQRQLPATLAVATALPAEWRGLLEAVSATYIYHDQQLAELSATDPNARYLLAAQLAYDYAFAFRFETDGSITREWATEGFERLTGYHWADLTPLGGIQAITLAEDRLVLQERNARAQAGEDTVVEYRICTRRGDIRWLRSHTQPIWDGAQQRVVQVVGAVQDITPQKTMEIALRDSETHLRGLMETLPDTMFRLDAAGRIVDYKAERNSDLYVPPARFLGRAYAQVLPPHVSDAIAQALAAAQRTRQVQSLEYELEFNGQLSYYEARLSLIPTGGAIVLVRNVTDRKRDEAQLRYQARLFDKISDGIVSVDQRGHITSWNQAAELIYGTPAATMLGQPIAQLFRSQHQPGLRRVVERALLATGAWAGELSQTRPDGRMGHIYVSAVVLRDATGAFTGAVAVLRDITARKEAEAAQERQLHENEALLRFSQLFSSSLELPIVLRNVAQAAATFIEKVDRVVVHLIDPSHTGLQVAAVSGREGYPEPMTFRLGEGIAGRVALTGETIYLQNVEQDARFVPITAHPERVRALVVAPIVAGEKILGTLSISNPQPNAFSAEASRLLPALGHHAGAAIENARLYADLATALSHEQHLREHLVQSTKLAAMGRLLDAVTHELNNPLQAIQNSLFLVGQDPGLGALGREDLQTAFAEVNRMVDLVSRLRDTYRPTRPGEFQVQPLPPIVENVARIIGTHLRHARVALVIEAEPDLPPVRMVADQLQQALLNLCLNAVEAMPHGGHLTLTLQRAADQVLLIVKDTGIGIEAEDLTHIFDPFFSTKTTGPGLGLSITYEIIQNHQGRIEAESALGRGTTFHIWLPASPPALS